MDFSRQPISKNFEDRTWQSQFAGMLQAMLNPKTRPSDIDPEMLPPGGYDHWLINSLNNLRPEDWEDMHKRGMSMSDIDLIKNLKKYGPLNTIDPKFRKLYYPDAK